MSAQSIANRSHRGGSHVSSEDLMMARAAEFGQWARANIRAIVIGAVVLGLLVAGLLAYRVSQAQRQERAAVEFMQLERSVNAQNPQLAAKDLERFVTKYDGTNTAEEARVTLAQMYMEQNLPAKAIATLKGAESKVDDSPVGPQAALLLGAAQLAAGNAKAAVETYLAVSKDAPLEFHRLEALENAAAVRAQTGDHRGAAELWQQLAESAEKGSPQRALYEMRAAEAQAAATK